MACWPLGINERPTSNRADDSVVQVDAAVEPTKEAAAALLRLHLLRRLRLLLPVRRGLHCGLLLQLGRLLRLLLGSQLDISGLLRRGGLGLLILVGRQLLGCGSLLCLQRPGLRRRDSIQRRVGFYCGKRDGR